MTGRLMRRPEYFAGISVEPTHAGVSHRRDDTPVHAAAIAHSSRFKILLEAKLYRGRRCDANF